MKQKEYFGFNSIKNLKDILEIEESKNIFLITGKNSYEICGAKKNLEKELQNRQFIRFCDFSSNPKLKEIDKGFNLFEKGNYDIVVAVGGGSVIDVGKAIKLFNYEKTKKKIPLIAIPTTAGSGSEATYFIVYYKSKEKQSKGEQDITLPNYAIIDPQFTMSLPKDVVASTGIDALGQAIESYWSVNSTSESKNFAYKSIRLLIGNLEKVVDSSSRQLKEKIMLGANLAGKAINLTKTTACHAIAYPMTSYFGISHGHAVGLTLGEMLIFNFNVCEKDCLDKRGPEYVKKITKELCELLESSSVEEGRKKIKRLMRDVGLEINLSKLNLEKKDLELIIKKGFTPERVKNNPRLLTEENLRKILNNIFY